MYCNSILYAGKKSVEFESASKEFCPQSGSDADKTVTIKSKTTFRQRFAIDLYGKLFISLYQFTVRSIAFFTFDLQEEMPFDCLCDMGVYRIKLFPFNGVKVLSHQFAVVFDKQKDLMCESFRNFV